MAQLTRKFLKALGMEDDAKIDEIITAHTDTLDAIKQERDTLKDESAKLAEALAREETLKTRVAELESAGGKAAEVQAAYDAYKAQVEGEKRTAAITAKVREAMRSAGANPKALDLLMKAVPLDKFDLDGDTLKDDSKALDALKSQYADFFGTVENKGPDHLDPPSGGEGGGSSAAARIAKAYHESLYGKTE